MAFIVKKEDALLLLLFLLLLLLLLLSWSNRLSQFNDNNDQLCTASPIRSDMSVVNSVPSATFYGHSASESSLESGSLGLAIYIMEARAKVWNLRYCNIVAARTIIIFIAFFLLFFQLRETGSFWSLYRKHQFASLKIRSMDTTTTQQSSLSTATVTVGYNGSINGSIVELSWDLMKLFFQILFMFFSILLTHKGSHREVYRDFQPSLTSSAGGAKGWLDHRFGAPLVSRFHATR